MAQRNRGSRKRARPKKTTAAPVAPRGRSPRGVTARAKYLWTSLKAATTAHGLWFSALALLIIAVYSPILTGAGFIWDDSIIHEGSVFPRWSGLADIWFDPGKITQESHYWPVTYTSFWLDYRLWGANPNGYHAFNLALHFVNSVLIWALLRRLQFSGAWWVAAIFAIHPVHVEPVAWIIARKDLLATTFVLLAVQGWLSFLERPRAWPYALVVLLYVAALLSKTSAAALPAVLLLLTWWRRGYLNLSSILLTVPPLLLGLAITLLDLRFYQRDADPDFSYDLSLLERLLNMAHSFWFYIGKLLWPADLFIIYPLWEIKLSDPVAWAYLAAGVAVAAGLWIFRKRLDRGLIASLLFFGVVIGPSLGLVSNRYFLFSYVADRYQYLASIGLTIAVVGVGLWCLRHLPARAWLAGPLLGIATLAALGTVAWNHAKLFKDPVQFFHYILDVNPNAPRAHNNLVYELRRKNLADEAMAAARTAIAVHPDNAKTFYNLSVLLREANQLDESLAMGRVALEMKPEMDNVNFNLANALMGLKRHDEAAVQLRKALKKTPDSINVQYNLGEAYRQLGRHDEAAAILEKLVALNPGNPDFLATLALTRFAQGKQEEAIATMRKSIALDPSNAASQPILEFMLDRADTNQSPATRE